MRSLPGLTIQSEHSPSDTNNIKIFCDGSWSGNSKRGGWAAVAMVDNTVIQCISGFSVNSSSSFVEEIRGLLAVMNMAVSMGFASVDFYADNSNLIWSLQSGYRGDDYAGLLLAKTSNLFYQNLKWSINHVFRDFNSIADFLARKARTDQWSWDLHNAIPIIPKDIVLQFMSQEFLLQDND